MICANLTAINKIKFTFHVFSYKELHCIQLLGNDTKHTDHDLDTVVFGEEDKMFSEWVDAV